MLEKFAFLALGHFQLAWIYLEVRENVDRIFNFWRDLVCVGLVSQSKFLGRGPEAFPNLAFCRVAMHPDSVFFLHFGQSRFEAALHFCFSFREPCLGAVSLKRFVRSVSMKAIDLIDLGEGSLLALGIKEPISLPKRHHFGHQSSLLWFLIRLVVALISALEQGYLVAENLCRFSCYFLISQSILLSFRDKRGLSD